MKTINRVLWLLLLLASTLFAIDDLKLNPHLDYGSDSIDGPLITGSDAQSGFVSGKTNYVIMYGEGCFNSKRQARRTVELYNKYRSQVHFVVVDLDVERSPEQQKLVKQYYKDANFPTSWFWMDMAKLSTTSPEKWIPELLKTLKRAAER